MILEVAFQYDFVDEALKSLPVILGQRGGEGAPSPPRCPRMTGRDFRASSTKSYWNATSRIIPIPKLSNTTSAAPR